MTWPVLRLSISEQAPFKSEPVLTVPKTGTFPFPWTRMSVVKLRRHNRAFGREGHPQMDLSGPGLLGDTDESHGLSTCRAWRGGPTSLAEGTATPGGPQLIYCTQVQTWHSQQGGEGSPWGHCDGQNTRGP